MVVPVAPQPETPTLLRVDFDVLAWCRARPRHQSTDTKRQTGIWEDNKCSVT